MEDMTTPSPAERLTSLLESVSTEERYEALIALAVALEAEGMHQRDMFILFDRELRTADAAENDALSDDLRESIDRITGWCENSQKIFQSEGV